jgi:NAD(P)-dependent dehydrogenase (short-subunit alcohol dehydrogenase family)
MAEPYRDNRLNGKVAIVTGAGSRGDGIGNGRATAVLLARHGARVTLVDTETPWVEATARMIEGEGGVCQIARGDVSKDADCAGIVQKTVSAWHRLDILVNNVGVIGPPGNALAVDMDAWDRAMQVNVNSMVLMARHAIPEMKKTGGGSIINLSSIVGLQGGHPSLLYPTSKGAIISLTRTMAAHHGRDGIRINCIAPGSVHTPMVYSRGMSDEIREARKNRSMLRTEGTAWDIGYGALFLASDESRWITGAILPIDAGASAGTADFPSPPIETMAQQGKRS